MYRGCGEVGGSLWGNEAADSSEDGRDRIDLRFGPFRNRERSLPRICSLIELERRVRPLLRTTKLQCRFLILRLGGFRRVTQEVQFVGVLWLHALVGIDDLAGEVVDTRLERPNRLLDVRVLLLVL